MNAILTQSEQAIDSVNQARRNPERCVMAAVSFALESFKPGTLAYYSPTIPSEFTHYPDASISVAPYPLQLMERMTSHFPDALLRPRRTKPTYNGGKQNKRNNMKLKLMVQTQTFDNWPATKDRAASSSHNLICLDMSQPAEARMTESLSYRLQEPEIPKYWDKAMDKTIEVICRRIAHSKSGKASIIGEIVEDKLAAK